MDQQVHSLHGDRAKQHLIPQHDRAGDRFAAKHLHPDTANIGHKQAITVGLANFALLNLLQSQLVGDVLGNAQFGGT